MLDDRKIVLFPVTARKGKIREVASRMLAKPTTKAAQHYSTVINGSMAASFDRIGLTADEQRHELEKFWRAVQSEMIRDQIEEQGGVA